MRKNSQLSLLNWQQKKGHHKGAQLAQKVYRLAHECVTFEPSHKVAALSVKHCVSLLRSIEQATDSIITQMDELAKELPEYEIVKRMKGVGDKLAPPFNRRNRGCETI